MGTKSREIIDGNLIRQSVARPAAILVAACVVVTAILAPMVRARVAAGKPRGLDVIGH
jgi:hypothetical protein